MIKEPLQNLFNNLVYHLNGFNYDGERFDFEYDSYTFTMVYRDNQIQLADNVDVYDEHDNFKGNWSLKDVNTAENYGDLPQ